jgi:hypothetical protein
MAEAVVGAPNDVEIVLSLLFEYAESDSFEARLGRNNLPQHASVKPVKVSHGAFDPKESLWVTHEETVLDLSRHRQVCICWGLRC